MPLPMGHELHVRYEPGPGTIQNVDLVREMLCKRGNSMSGYLSCLARKDRSILFCENDRFEEVMRRAGFAAAIHAGSS